MNDLNTVLEALKELSEGVKNQGIIYKNHMTRQYELTSAVAQGRLEGILNKAISTLTAHIQRDSNMAAQAYQVIGSLADEAGMFDSPDVTRALDYFSNGEYDEEFLPWSCERDGGDALEALDSLADRFEFEQERQAGINYRIVRQALQSRAVADVGCAEKLADKFVWQDGDGCSTARGVRTRELLREAFLEGYKEAERGLIAGCSQGIRQSVRDAVDAMGKITPQPPASEGK